MDPTGGTHYKVTKSFFTSEKIEYFCRILIKGTDSCTTDKGTFIAHIHRRNVDESCFEVLLLP
jgi:hypothetical protein